MENSRRTKTPSKSQKQIPTQSSMSRKNTHSSGKAGKPKREVNVTDFSSARSYQTQHSETKASILYRTITESDKERLHTNTSSSPPRAMTQPNYTSDSEKTKLWKLERKPTTSNIRTQTYSPVQDKKPLYSNRSPTSMNFEPGSFFYESPGKKKISLGTSSVQVMKKVFDEEYSLHSPSRKKFSEKETQESFQEHLKTDKSSQGSTSARIREPEINFEILNNAYRSFLEKLHLNPMMQNADVFTYISESLSYFSYPDTDLKLGAIINIFDMIYYNKPNISEEQLSTICLQLLNYIPKYQALEDFYPLYFALETLAIIGPNDTIYENINILMTLITESSDLLIKEKAIQTLADFDYPGLFALLDLTNKDFDELPLDILNRLAQVPEIQARVIVPSLLNSLSSGDSKKKYSSLAALNRMFAMIRYGGGLPVLINLLNEGNLEREIIASCIMASGPSGEQTLLKILKATNNTKIKQAICSVLPWRIERYDRSFVGIRIVPYKVSEHYQSNPGTMCTYLGSLKPFSQLGIAGELPSSSSTQTEDIIEINSRDFLASLQRLISLKYQEFNTKEKQNTPSEKVSPSVLQNSEDLKNFNNASHLILADFLTNQEEREDARPKLPQVSSNIIKTLIQIFNHKDSAVRESVVHAFGLIGPPEAVDALEILDKALYDTEGQVRALSAWALGKLGDITPPKTAKRLIELLRDKFWKVRTSACISLGYMGGNIGTQVFALLIKVLKEGTINKVVVCETLVRLGVQGEHILLDILKNSPNTDYGLKSAIIQSFELADVDRPTIDFVIEELFKNAADSMVQVRKACLLTLEKLRLKAHNNNITYLKSRNILPLFYYFLRDSDDEIRAMALQSIYLFGPQGELMLIEGLAKDKTPIIRAECARGLGLYGPQTFRTLLFGLRDNEEIVRLATAATLKSRFTPEIIIRAFNDKHHQKPGLIYSIGEILKLNYYYSDPTRRFLLAILNHFQNELNMSGSVFDTQQQSVDNQDKADFITITEYEENTEEMDAPPPLHIQTIGTSHSLNLSPREYENQRYQSQN